MEYWQAVEVARDLLSEQIAGEPNPEYTRGVCELLCDCFGRPGRRGVAQDIGLPVEQCNAL